MAEEAALLDRARAGDRQALAALVARYQQPVWDLALYLLQDREEAADVAQEALVRACQSLDRLRPGAPWRPWVLRIAANLATDRLRRRRRAPLPLAEALPVPDPAPPPEEALARREAAQAVRRAVAALPPAYRALVVLFHVHGVPQEELAAAFGLSVSQVKNRLYRARRMLRPALEGVWAP